MCLTKAKASGFGGTTPPACHSTAQRVCSARTKLDLALEAEKVSIHAVLRGIEERPGGISGLAQLYLGKPDVAREASVLEGYVAAQPADSQALTLLASAYMAQGRNNRAINLMSNRGLPTLVGQSQ